MEQFTIMPIFIPIVLLFIILNLNKLTKLVIPNNWQLINESLYYTILSLLKTNLSINKLFYFPLIFTIFYMIFISNFVGLIPYSTTASTEIIITLFIAFGLLPGIFIFGIFNHGLTHIVYLFLPAGTPIFLLPLMIPLEILAYITRTLSLGLRLAVNLITGHILVKICLSLGINLPIYLLFLPILFIIAFLALEVLIAYLQAYIFVFITIITLRDIMIQ